MQNGIRKAQYRSKGERKSMLILAFIGLGDDLVMILTGARYVTGWRAWWLFRDDD